MNHFVEIAASALCANYRVLCEAARAEDPGTDVLAVVKADAYGHGAELCAPVLVEAGARSLGVTDAAEGVRVRESLRAAGLAEVVRILVMCGSLPEEVPAMVAAGLTPVVWTPEQVDALRGTGLRVELEVDTGMARQGVLPGAALEALLRAIAEAGLLLGGVFTHFAASEVVGSARTSAQRGRFERAVAQVGAALDRFAPDAEPLFLHAGNTSTLDNPQCAEAGGSTLAWLGGLARALAPVRPVRLRVRSGLALYGYCLPLEGAGEPRLRGRLEPVLCWRARVLAVRALGEGETVGYSAAFTAPRPMRVALLPVGYADGLRRELGSTGTRVGGYVLFGAARAPILGRVSMNLLVVDVSGLAAVRAGDTATLLGPGVDADEHARLAGTIPYEILCNVKAPRRLAGAAGE